MSESWRGALPITYHIGPGPAQVHLKLVFDWSLTPAYNVVATLRGSEFPDEWVVRGNHHDAWANGAEDPISGMIAELEEARALGELVKQGWRPRRTLVYAAWDAEEPALLGSTEWAEHHADELRQKAVLYLNTDGNGRGYLYAGGSHSLERLVNEVAREIEDPESGVSVWRRAQAGRVMFGSAADRNEARERADLRIDALGSGSDFTPFLQHLGMATLNMGFGGEDGGGIYHSIYDTYAWYSRFSDTAFVYGRALAQVAGTVVMRMANADILPHEFGALAETVGGYVRELTSLREEVAGRIAETNRRLDDGVYAATTDPRAPLKPPAREAPAPFLNFAPLENASAELARAASRYEKAYDAALGMGSVDRGLAARVNGMLRDAERTLTSPEGLPNRPWYRHLLYAPGLYTGYGVKTMPAAREAIEQKQWSEAEREIARIAAALSRAASHLDRIAEALQRP